MPQVIKTVGYTNFSPFIPIPSPIIAPAAGTLTAINPIVINNFTIIASPMHFLQNEISANHKLVVSACCSAFDFINSFSISLSISLDGCRVSLNRCNKRKE